MEKNYYLNLMDKELEAIKKSGLRPRLLLHSCCAPCSSSVIELLTEYFDVAVYYYNPNIYIRMMNFLKEQKSRKGSALIFLKKRIYG